MRTEPTIGSYMCHLLGCGLLILSAICFAGCDAATQTQDTAQDDAIIPPADTPSDASTDDNLHLDLDDGETEDDNAVETENTTNTPPLVRAEARVSGDSTIELDGSATTDPDGDALTYSWRQTDGTPQLTLESPEAPVARAPIPDLTIDTVLEFTLTADDGTDTSSATVEVELATPIAPASADVQLVIEASLVSGDAPLSVDFTAATQDGQPLPAGMLLWDFGDSEEAQGDDVSHVFTAAGMYVVTLCSEEVAAICGTVDIEVTEPSAFGGGGGGGGAPPVVTNQAPVAVAVANPSEAPEGANVVLDGSASSDPDNGPAPLTYTWTQMEGTDVTGDPQFDAGDSQPQFTAPTFADDPQQDTLVFELTVQDGGSVSTPASVTVTITAPEPVPPDQRHAGMPDSWLVLYNLNNADSIAWKDWYIEQWQIPAENTLGLNVDANLERIHRDEFDNEIFFAVYDHLAANAELSSKIMAILVGYRVPGCFYLNATTPANQSGGGWSVSSKLQNLDPADIHAPLVFGNPHSMAVAFDDYEDRPTKATLIADAYITARIDAPTLDEAKLLTTRAKAISSGAVSLGASDLIYYDHDDPGSPGGDEWYKLRVAVESTALNTPPADYPWQAFVSDGAGEEEIPSCAFYFSYYRLTGWQNAPWSGTPAGPRVLAFAFNSFGATTVRSTTNHSGRFVPNALFTGGFAAAVGATAEPYVSHSPYPGTMVWCLRDGRTMGEAVFQASPRRAWMWELVGDPFLTVPTWFSP